MSQWPNKHTYNLTFAWKALDNIPVAEVVNATGTIHVPNEAIEQDDTFVFRLLVHRDGNVYVMTQAPGISRPFVVQVVRDLSSLSTITFRTSTSSVTAMTTLAWPSAIIPITTSDITSPLPSSTSGNSHRRIGVGAIVGIGLGCVFGLVFLYGAIFALLRLNTKRKNVLIEGNDEPYSDIGLQSAAVQSTAPFAELEGSGVHKSIGELDGNTRSELPEYGEIR